LIRNVVVPANDYKKALLLNRHQFEQIKNKAKVKSKEAIDAEIGNARNAQVNELAAATQRKQRFQDMDLHRKENKELNELELEAKVLNEHLLEKAKAKRLEQEDEIKHLNELILNAKVNYSFLIYLMTPFFNYNQNQCRKNLKIPFVFSDLKNFKGFMMV